MVDSVLVVVPFADRLPMLDNLHSATSSKTGLPFRTGDYRAMSVKVNADGEIVLRGSLATYHFGDNVRTMTRADVRASVASLTDAFGTDPSECRIYRLDLAATLAMPRPVACYLSLLASVSRMKRADYHGETATFYNMWRTLTFYDKGKEAGVNGSLLRFEVQFQNNVKRQLGFSCTLADLADADRFTALVRRWEAEYHKVTKRQRPRLTPTERKSDLRRQLASIGLDCLGGIEELLPLIEDWDLDRRKTHTLRRELRDLSTLGGDEDDGALIRELDAAIEEAARYALTS